MTGAILNAVAIVIGGIVGLLRAQPIGMQTQMSFKLMLGALALFFGLRLTWLSINETAGMVLKQVVIALLALMLGNLLGTLMRLQSLSNRAGQYARRMIEQNRPGNPHRFSQGMNTCAVLFCAAPLGLVGALQDGLPVIAGDPGYFYPMLVKALMDGLAMMGFVTMFGPGAILSALPVFVFFGTITMASHIYLEPFLRARELLDPVNATGGLLVCVVAVVIFEIRRVQLANYLPALVVAPLLAWIWK